MAVAHNDHVQTVNCRRKLQRYWQMTIDRIGTVQIVFDEFSCLCIRTPELSWMFCALIRLPGTLKLIQPHMCDFERVSENLEVVKFRLSALIGP